MSALAWWLSAVLLSASPGGDVQRLYFRRAGAVVAYDVASRSERVLWPERDADAEDPPIGSSDGASVFFGLRRQVWQVAASGGQPRRLTPAGAPDDCADQPVPAPTGRWLAWRLRPAAAPAQLHLLDLDARTDHLLASGVESLATWKPDGSQLVYAANGRLWRAGPSLEPPVALTDGPHDGAPVYLPAGEVLFNRDTLPMLLAPDGQVSAATPHGFDAGQVFPSTDGQRLALARTVLDPRSPQRCWTELHVVELATGRCRLVLSTYAPAQVNGRARLLGWLNGRWLLVLRDLGEPSRKVYAVDTVTSRGELVLKGRHEDDGFSLWPAGGLP